MLEGVLLAFAGLILACLFAWFLLPHFNQPAGYIWINNWLQNFSGGGRTEIGPDVFAVPLVFALVILVLSVSYKVVKSALQNPAESIRAE